MERKRIRLKMVSFCFTFLLTLLLITLLLCLNLYFGIFDGRSILRKVNESRYYNEIYTELNAEAEDIVTQSGLPVTVLTDVITLERVYISGKQYVEATLKGNPARVSTDKLGGDLLQNINKYLEVENILQTEELTTGITSMITEVEKTYQQGIHFEFIRMIAEYRQKYITVIRWLVPIILLFISIICYYLINIHDYKHRGLRCISYSVNASSLLMIGSAICMLVTKQYEITSVKPEHYRSFLSLLMKWNVSVSLYLGCIGAAISLILITLLGIMKKRMNT